MKIINTLVVGQLGFIGRFILLLFVSSSFAGFAQQTIVVNGETLSEASSRLVPGRAYAAIDSFAAAIGLDVQLDLERQVVSFTYAGSLYNITIADSVGRATTETSAIRIDGSVYPSPAAIQSNGLVYVPIRELSLALGATVDFIAETNTVLVVFPRARLLSISVTGSGTNYDRLRLRFDRPTSVEEYSIPGLDFVRFRFDRTDINMIERYSGRYFTDASVQVRAGQVDLLVELRPDSRVESYSTKNATGFELIVDIFGLDAGTPAQVSASQSLDATSGIKVVIDPAHGGADRGLFFPEFASNERSLTFALAQRLLSGLSAPERQVTLTRQSDLPTDPVITVQQRSQLGIASDLFISLQIAQLSPREINVYYLGDAAQLSHLDMAIERNAEELVAGLSTDSLRREILLQSMPNLLLGQQYAALLSSELRAMGYQANALSAPLYVLRGAAGRGLLVEASVEASLDSSFPEVLVTSVNRVIERGLGE